MVTTGQSVVQLLQCYLRAAELEMRAAEGARAKLRGQIVDKEETRDREAIERWAKAEGVDLENEAQRAKSKLGNVDRA